MPGAHQLRRHPIAISCTFERSLVVSWAFPAEVLAPLVPRGLTLDSYNDAGAGEWGFVVLAAVQARDLRPRGAPRWLGQSFSLVGYRLFVRHRDSVGRTRRGLHILSSDTDRRAMRWGGNLLTHYGYRRSKISIAETADRFEVGVTTRGAVADLQLAARLDPSPAPLPSSSPFRDPAAARRFAGPMPWTFDHESQSDSIVMVRGRRSHWRPHATAVDVERCTFFEQQAFAGIEPRLANAFSMEGMDYSWDRGVRDPVTTEDHNAASQQRAGGCGVAA